MYLFCNWHPHISNSFISFCCCLYMALLRRDVVYQYRDFFYLLRFRHYPYEFPTSYYLKHLLPHLHNFHSHKISQKDRFHFYPGLHILYLTFLLVGSVFKIIIDHIIIAAFAGINIITTPVINNIVPCNHNFFGDIAGMPSNRGLRLLQCAKDYDVQINACHPRCRQSHDVHNLYRLFQNDKNN